MPSLLSRLYKQASKQNITKNTLTNEYYGSRDISYIRQIISVIIYNETRTPFSDISKAVGYKDKHEVLKHARRYREDPSFRSDVDNFHARSLLG